MPFPPARPTPDSYGPPLPLPPITAMPPPVAAGEACRAALRGMGAMFDAEAPPRAAHAECSVDNPVRLRSVQVSRKAGAETVALDGKPLLACETALAVTGWVQRSIAPLARGHFDEPLTALGVGGGFECRQRNHQSSAPRSEHSYGRALDIMTFTIGSRTIKVEKNPPADAQAFLRAVWASGCGTFSTVLGPEADAFHETHIHVDQQPRRAESSKFCE